MRRLVLISSLVGLFFYTGVVTQAGSPTSPHVSIHSGAATGSGLASLQDALSAIGAATEQVTITGWVETTEMSAASKLSWALGGPEGVQTVRSKHSEKQYLSVQRVLTGSEIDQWDNQAERIRRALTRFGRNPVFTVQLMGSTDATDVKGLVKKALNALQATEQRKWGDGKAASMEGWSPKLPAGPYDVNVQVAARHGGPSGSSKTRFWVGWPALQQEF